ncbi:hypothetical protein L5515_009429 [Caenorhabditis briggsae]|uniref:Uncharacterized protein n=1 Tax=Caenorhabditis briggsae TaxID=6238 RepID=A0AAE9F442_CAEBR|nr:hypothetical protein L5515_009429 [Caenorhabditis briggsae]
MLHSNRSALYVIILIFGFLFYLQWLREKTLRDQLKDSDKIQNSTTPTNFYSVENYGEEGILRNLTIQTRMENEKYCVGYNFLEATESFREADNLEPVSLVTHATPDMMETIEKLTNLWDGPISLGIFIDSNSRNVLEYLTEIYRCDMTVHFAFLHKSSDSSDANCPIITISNSENTCQNFFASRESSFCELQFSNELQYTNELYYTSPLKYVNKLQYAKFELKYINELQYTSKLQYTKNALRTAIVGPFQNFPHNLMRNIARKGSKSGLHILMDGDMIPSQNFAIKIKEIANRIIDGKHKKVLAIRRFETESGMDIPTDNKKLLDSKILQRTFEFHHRYFTAGYSIEGLDEWFKKCEETDMVTASLVPYPGYIWEIHPILHRKDPYNADYFPSRVKTMHALI